MVNISVAGKAPWRGRLLVLAGILLVAFTLRCAVTVVPPLVSTMSRDLPFNATTIGLLGMLPTAAFAVFGFCTPFVIRWASLEKLAVIAMGVAAAGQVARIFAPTTSVFLLLTVMSLAGLGAGNVLLPPLVKQYFPDRVGLLTALYVTVLSLGTALPPQLAVPVSDAAGWQWSLGLWAGANVLAALPWLAAAAAARRRPDRVPAARPGPAPSPRINPWRSPAALGLTFMFGCTSLNTYAMFAWLPGILTQAGLDRGAAGSMLALFAAIGLPLSLLVPVAAHRMANPFPLVVFFLLCFIGGYLGLLNSPASGTWLWVTLAGMGPGTFPLALLLINLRTRTRAGAGALSGFSQGTGYALACAGPLLFGILHQSTGGWLIPFCFLFATLALLAGGAWFICRPRFFDAEAPRAR
ncbi:MAG: MFS transporter [Actinomycetales bacterium]